MSFNIANRFHRHIAVLTVQDIIGIFAIFATDAIIVHESNFRNASFKFIKLLKEGAVFFYLLAVL